MKQKYPISRYKLIISEAVGGYIATLEEVPAIQAVGANRTEAYANLRKAFRQYVKNSAHIGMPMPKLVLRRLFTNKPEEPAGGHFNLPCACHLSQHGFVCPKHMQ